MSRTFRLVSTPDLDFPVLNITGGREHIPKTNSKNAFQTFCFGLFALKFSSIVSDFITLK